MNSHLLNWILLTTEQLCLPKSNFTYASGLLGVGDAFGRYQDGIHNGAGGHNDSRVNKIPHYIGAV